MISLSVNELAEIISKTVKACLIDWKPAQRNQDTSVYLTRAQVCDRLHISLPTVHAWMKKGILKPYHIGGRTLFRESEVMTEVNPASFDIPAKSRGIC